MSNEPNRRSSKHVAGALKSGGRKRNSGRGRGAASGAKGPKAKQGSKNNTQGAVINRKKNKSCGRRNKSHSN